MTYNIDNTQRRNSALPYRYHSHQQPHLQNPQQSFLDYDLQSLDSDPALSHRNNNLVMTVDPNNSFDNMFDNNSSSTANQNNNNTTASSSTLQQVLGQQRSLRLSNERIGIDTTNITNPALNSFFQLPFELQIQQFPLTNPPLFDFQFQQPYYQGLSVSNAFNESGVIPNDHSQFESQQQQQQHQAVSNNQLNSSNNFPRGSYSPNPQQLHPQQIPSGYTQPQPTLRRRISISNGQIGQLVQFTQQQIQLLNPTYSPEAVLAAASAVINQNTANTLNLPAAVVSPHNVSETSPQQQQHSSPHTLELSKQDNLSPGNIPTSQIQLQARASIHQIPLPQDRERSSNQNIPGHTDITTNANGVPQHQLLYNNEIIFNPNNGPIPGTSAWKKQKLLERNRIAASKCRQRKKQQQRRLEQDIDKYVRDNKNLELQVKILEKKLHKFTKIMEVHFQKCHSGDNSFPLLKELINDTEEEFAKVKLEDDDYDEFDNADDGTNDDSEFLNDSEDVLRESSKVASDRSGSSYKYESSSTLTMS